VPPPLLRATYRLQLGPHLTLRDATALVPYLDRLGISHLYLSPVLRSRAGSEHGYDVVDPTQLDPELGSYDEWRSLSAAARSHDMGVLLDIVPNHMGVGSDNPFWTDVFANGPRSPYAHWFDIDWDAGRGALRHRVLVPVLADELSNVVSRGEIGLSAQAGELVVRYFDHVFPLSPESRRQVLQFGVEHGLPLQEAARQFAGGPGGPARLTHLLEQQVYALAPWQRASAEINYRRFFDINDLVALRQEDPTVFEGTHRRVLQWTTAGLVNAVRVDHVDGLLDPRSYLERLRARVGPSVPVVVEKILSANERLRADWSVQGTTGYDFLNQMEAALVDPAGARMLDSRYRALLAPRVRPLDFAEEARRAKAFMLRTNLEADVRRLVRVLRPLVRVVERGGHGPVVKRQQLRQRIGARALFDALVAVIACLPVYRTYFARRSAGIAANGAGAPMHGSAEDMALVQGALACAERHESVDAGALRVIRRAIDLATALPVAGAMPQAVVEAAVRFVEELQQTSGPAAAKGVEDTALYRYAPLASLNEVGSDPGVDLDDAVERLHASNALRAMHWPMTLTAASTHDTKRSADIRSRVDVLSELPDFWWTQVRRWLRAHESLRRLRGRRRYPDRPTMHLLYQSALGIWPAELTEGVAGEEIRGRLTAYMLKASREAKGRTTWTAQNAEFERALESLITAISVGDAAAAFADDMRRLVTRIARPALWNAIARMIVQFTAPGVPDIYQGDEWWNASLVDPDNRRPVDFAGRAAMLDTLLANVRAGVLPDELLDSPHDDRLKLWLTARLLRVRAEHAPLFAHSAYHALRTEGESAGHVVAFAREELSGGALAVVIVPRLTVSLFDESHSPVGHEVWRSTRVVLPIHAQTHTWRCALTGRAVVSDGERKAILLGDAFGALPGTVLMPAA